MYQQFGSWPVSGGAGALAPRAGEWAVPPVSPARGPRLAVDLTTGRFSSIWWRGVATLALLGSAAGAMAPDMGPLPGHRAAPLPEPQAAEARAIGIGPLAGGARTGRAMDSSPAVVPLAHAPDRPRIAITARLAPGESLFALLMRSGVSADDAARAARLIGQRLAAGTAVELTLGRRGGAGRPIEQLAVRASFELNITLRRAGGQLVADRRAIPVDRTPLRIRGRIGDGLYWSLRSAGASPSIAQQYLSAIAGEVEVGSETGPDDRFDLVLAHRRSERGESEIGPLLYAGLDRASSSDLQLVRWTAGGRSEWINAARPLHATHQGAGMLWPVAARISSGFGLRVHPILGFARMHKGVDFAARSGTPIHAAADGQVVRAGWAGGYGRQVRIVHGGALATSYSHMSGIAVEPGTIVRQGQVIGYVGSSGLSTGPHLHYEVHRGGVPVNPLSVRFASAPAVDDSRLKAVRARLHALLSIGRRRG